MLYEIVWGSIMLTLSTAAYAGLSAAPWVPTRRKEIDALHEALAIKTSDIIVDLGTGTGSILFAFAKKSPDATYIGYEVSLLPFLVSRVRQLFPTNRKLNVHLRYGDLFRANLADATIIVSFLTLRAYPRLKEKFARELSPDTKVAIEAWPFEDIAPQLTIRPALSLPFYLYEARQFKKNV